uniref:Uncharacterized protein n=1 Tax=Anguilla anguilla TaxID=7936 RepID=A0A0E9VNI9_ANGAN
MEMKNLKVFIKIVHVLLVYEV